jgi:hypothetical protein
MKRVFVEDDDEPKPMGLTERIMLVLISLVIVVLGVWYLLK